MKNPNHPPDDFERRLATIAPRQIPPEWKTEILANAAAPVSRPLWRRPAVLALAACWVVSFALQIAKPETTDVVAQPEAATSADPALIIAWIEQRRSFLHETDSPL